MDDENKRYKKQFKEYSVLKDTLDQMINENQAIQNTLRKCKGEKDVFEQRLYICTQKEIETKAKAEDQRKQTYAQFKSI